MRKKEKRNNLVPSLKKIGGFRTRVTRKLMFEFSDTFEQSYAFSTKFKPSSGKLNI